MSKLIRKFDLCVVVRKYNDDYGEEKKVWRSIGELLEFENGFSMELYHIPGRKISVFERKPKDQKAQQSEPQNSQPAQEYNYPFPSDDIRP